VKLLYSIDRTKKPQKISLFLAKPNRDVIRPIPNAFDITQTIKLGQINSLSFSIPYEIVINHVLNRNPIVDLVREKYLIKAVFGQSVEWYVITQKKKSMGDSDSISLECFSLGYELKYKKLINYKASSLNCFQVLSEILQDTNWTVGYVNPDFYLKYRQFDVSSKSKLDFIDEICETFQGVATYETVNRKVSIWKEDELSTYKGFWISYGKYLETIEDTVSTDEIVTRLVVTANENASINSANPTGQSYIDDFSYFLYPFNRGVSRTVLSSSYFMSDELCHAILDYNELINENAEMFSYYLSTKKSLDLQLTSLNNELQTLTSELNMILDEIEVTKQTGGSTTELTPQRDAKQIDIDGKENEINSINSQINKNDSDILVLNELLKFENNFQGYLLTEINDYIQVEEWSDENQLSDEDYFYAASDHMKTVSIPPVNLNLSIVNFFEIVEEQHNWDRLGIGDIIRVKHPKLEINVKTKITEITFNYDDGTINLSISNTKRPESLQKKFQQAFYKIDKLNTDYNKRKVNWETVATNFDARNDRNKTTPTTPSFPITNSVYHKQNDDGSVDLIVNWNYPDFNVTGKESDNVDGFMIYLYASSTNEKYVFGSSVAEETMVNVAIDKRIYTFPSVPSNQHFTLGIKAYRRVDADIDKNGILFSKTITANDGDPYLPNPQVIVKGNVEGRVNGVMHSVSVVEPVLAEENDVWVNPTTKQTMLYNGNSFEVTNAGDASTFSGKTVEDFILAEKVGVFDGVATLDSEGNVPLTQLENITSTIPILSVGNYVGDGTLSKTINLGFLPKHVKVYTTKQDDYSLFIPNESGGFLYKSNATNLFLEGSGTNKDIPATSFGKLTLDGFITGDTADTYANKLNITYYWEAFK
jgi:hypothetical protein